MAQTSNLQITGSPIINNNNGQDKSSSKPNTPRSNVTTSTPPAPSVKDLQDQLMAVRTYARSRNFRGIERNATTRDGT